MSEIRYPQGSVIADYCRGAVGLCLTAGPLLLVPVTTFAAIILGSMAILFSIFIIRTLGRQRTVAVLEEDGVTTKVWTTKSIKWDSLTHLQLRYFAVKRDRSQGWMQLILKDRRVTLRFDSTLSGFDEITKAAYSAAQKNGLVLSSTTMENLSARGLVKNFDPQPDLAV